MVMKNPYRMAVVAVLAAAVLVLSGCSGSSNGPASTDSAGGVEIKPTGDYNPLERDQIRDGGELNLAVSAVAEQSNPSHGNAVLDTTNLWYWYNPQLVLLDGDGSWHPNPTYLTNIKDEVVDGKTVVTYDINPDATFNDGTPLDWRVFEHVEAEQW